MNQKQTTKSFEIWRDCLKRNKDLRNKLALEENDREDRKMCLNRYRSYFESTKSNSFNMKIK